VIQKDDNESLREKEEDDNEEIITNIIKILIINEINEWDSVIFVAINHIKGCSGSTNKYLKHFKRFRDKILPKSKFHQKNNKIK